MAETLTLKDVERAKAWLLEKIDPCPEGTAALAALDTARAHLEAHEGVGERSLKERLQEIHSALDEAIGDTDVSHFDSDEELREVDPLMWAAMTLAHEVAMCDRAEDADALTALQSENTAKDGKIERVEKACLAQRHRAQDAEAEVLAKEARLSALKADNERLKAELLHLRDEGKTQ